MPYPYINNRAGYLQLSGKGKLNYAMGASPSPELFARSLNQVRGIHTPPVASGL